MGWKHQLDIYIYISMCMGVFKCVFSLRQTVQKYWLVQPVDFMGCLSTPRGTLGWHTVASWLILAFHFRICVNHADFWNICLRNCCINHITYWTISLYSCVLRIIYKTRMRENGSVSEWTCCASSAVLNHKTPAGSQWPYFQGGDWVCLLTARGLKLMSIPQSRAVCGVLNHQEVSVHLAISTNIRKLLTALWNWTVGNTFKIPAQAGYRSLLSWSTTQIKSYRSILSPDYD